MTSTVQAMIEQANTKTKNSNKQVFAKKASDQQHHLNLFKCVEIFIDAHRLDATSSNTKAALRELNTAMALSKRRLQA